MNPILATIKPGDSGAKVVNLIQSLLLLIEHALLKTYDSPNHPTADELAKLVIAIKEELAQQFFGDATQHLILYFQIQNNLGDSLGGVVEKKTASLLNKFLEKLLSQPNAQDYEVFGLVMDTKGRRMAGVEVRAFDRDWQRETVLGQTITDAVGAYRIAYPASLFRKTPAEIGGPELFVRAYDEQEFLLQQSATVPNADLRTEINLTIENNLRWVSGTVSDDSGRAQANLLVRAFDQDLRSEELLGECRTDNKGQYQISYSPAQFKRAEKASADLRVRVFANNEKELAMSATLFNAAERAVIDINFAAGLLQTASEWETYLAQLEPLLEKLPLHELTEEDCEFLNKETGIAKEYLHFIRLDALWRHEQQKQKLPASAFYGLLRQGFSTRWTDLLNAKPERWSSALKQAIADHQIPESIGQELKTFITKLTNIAVDYSFVAPAADTRQLPFIGVLLTATKINTKQQRIIAETLLGHSLHENPEQLIAQLAQAKIPPVAIKTAQFAIEAHSLVNQHLPTLVALQTSVAADFSAGADLAKLNRTQWLDISKNLAKTKNLPNEFKSKEDYAEYLADRIEYAFPTAVVAWQLTEMKEPVRRDLGLLLIQNPEFDLLSSPIDSFFKTAKLGKIKTKPELLKQQLGKEVRVARLVPTTNRIVNMTNMLEQGFDSAVKISLTGKQTFTSKMKNSSKAVAQQIYSLAKSRANDITLQTMYNWDRFDPTIRIIPPFAASPNSDLADWVELFGSLNGCYCPPCDSVHGPAAYLMDLFEFLKDKDAGAPAGGNSLLNVLFTRRPDLQHLKLNCANAETPLPYIDLVIELLEQQIAAVIAGADQAIVTAATTPQTPEQLPDLLTDTTDTTAIAARLRALPLSSPASEGFYASNGPLQSALYPWHLPFDRNFLQAGIFFSLIGTSASEVLGLTANPGVDLHRTRLNLSPASWDLLHNTVATSSSQVIAAWGLKNSLNALNQLGGTTGELLTRSGLSVDDLFLLVESELFKGWALVIDRTPTPQADPCNIDNAHLKQRIGTGPLTRHLRPSTQVEVFDLMHRILHLRVALGWPLARLIAVLQVLGVGKNSPSIDLVLVSQIGFLATQISVSIETFVEILLALQQSLDGSSAATHARNDWLKLLGLSETDHKRLTDLGLADSLIPQPLATRLDQLESALKTIALLRAANLDPAELYYLLRHEDLVPAVFKPSDKNLQTQWNTLAAAIQSTRVDIPELPALAPLPVGATASEREQRSDDEEARAELIALAQSELIARQLVAAKECLRVITGTTFIDLVIEDQIFNGLHTDALLPATGISGGVVQDFIALAVTQPDNEDHAARLLARATIPLLKVLKTTRLLSLLKITAADVEALAKLPRDGDTWLNFNRLFPVSSTTPLNLINIIGLIQTSITQNAMPKADSRLLQVIVDSTDAANAAENFETITGWGHSLNINSSSATDSQVLIDLAETLGLTDWRAPTIYASLQTAVQWLQGHRLAANTLPRLQDAASNPSLLVLPKTPEAVLEALTNLARNRFAKDKDWYKAITPAMDRLRARQRDALLTHLLHADSMRPADKSHNWKTADDVYAYLLIDVQMGPCQLSSRIVQAHSAVQLFVQRCLMNLEEPEEVLLGRVSDIKGWQQWDWMKNYRVWEAGRKVFLYPENWIEPDLRDNKSPFFEELENELLQSEISPESVERATRNYLTKLHEVARLDIRALYEETVVETHGDGTTSNSTIIHMVGRTQTIPHLYFYRKRLADLSWTAWEKIELSIDADHLVLTVHNRRPMLFWPQVKEIQISQSNSATALDMSLRVSSLEFGKWGAPTGSQDAIRIAKDQLPTLSLRPRVNQEHGTIEILVYEYLALSTRIEGVEFARGKFILDACTGNLSVNRINPMLIRLLPPFVEPYQQLLAERKDTNGSGTYIRFTTDTDDEHAFILSELPAEERRAIAGEILAELFLTILTFGTRQPSDRWIRHAADMDDPISLLFNAQVDGFTLLPCQQNAQFNYRQPYVLRYIDKQIFAIKMEKVPAPARGYQYLLESAEHPFLCDLLEALRADGLPGIYRPDEVARAPGWDIHPLKAKRHPRQLTEAGIGWVETNLRPNMNLVAKPHPISQFDFSEFAAFSLYNWEIFFHIPLLIADRLNKSGRYKEAQEWFHCIFDPTDVSPHPAPQKYWRVKPLFLQQQAWAPDAIESLEAMMRQLSAGASDVEKQVDAWRNDPFNPHLLARIRLVSYMKTVVQKYIDNLTAWGDSLFRRDTMESINEATQMYVLGSEILGAAPIVLPPLKRDARSYAELTSEDSVDEFANVLVGIETSLPLRADSSGRSDRTAPDVSMLYFCIPSNPRLQELRATINDRLFKIRHCMNIEGRTRQLALFAPPIDPALLVRARAAGMDIGAVLDMALGARMRHYRFQPLLQKAFEYCGEVRSFGGALLSALEKQDGELLGQVRARHEVGMLKLSAMIKRQQIEEAETNLEVIQRSQAVTQARFDFYTSNLAAGNNSAEAVQVSHLSSAHDAELVSSALNLGASIAYAFPDIFASASPGITWGGTNLGNALRAGASIASLVAQEYTYQASMSSINAGRQRRDDEWRNQIDLAAKELASIDQQIIAAEIRLAITQQDQQNHAKQIEQSQEIEAMLRDKFTNTQLYSWMSAQLSALHYQSYQMAFDLAKQAEAAANREVNTPSTFIQFDNWDGGRKGLLAGERLAQDLRRLDIAYMQANTRLLEITSNISLRRLNPNALWDLRLEKTCSFSLPAWLFDMDFPGQHGRRIKSVSISVPGVVGPYGGVNGILSCTPPGEAPRSIATSSGQNDAGVFQLDFRDERYLPFEGINLDRDTEWNFSLPAVFRPFDYETISDLVLHIQYTAREAEPVPDGRPSPEDIIRGRLQNITEPPLRLLLSVRHDFPLVSRQLQETTDPAFTSRVELNKYLFPYIVGEDFIIVSISRLVPRVPGASVVAELVTQSTNELLLTAADADSYFVVNYALTNRSQ
ncbi:MAG: neuraminidase-like domain-containing protein [Pseudomonadota bacterium]